MDKAEYKAVYRYARISPRKLRYMADLVRGKYADEALEILKYQPNRGARLLEKLILSARGNAVDRRVRDVDSLMITELCVDGGPMFKRFRPKARGSASVIKKRMSHIRITLS
ncbi:MAG: 50S ribosomal protein L22 [Planctomycetia bacterium]|nr:50S ribosomal protein L22 [Planctomycetia bacterium]